MKLFLLLAPILLVPSVALEQSKSQQPSNNEPSVLLFRGTGADLLERCNAIGTLKVGDRRSTSEIVDVTKHSEQCWDYIAGIVDAYQTLGVALQPSPNICLPPTVDLTQLEKVTKKYLDDNPAHLHERAGWLVLLALRDAFPCQ